MHFGYGFPLLVYTHDLELFEKVPNYRRELDEITLGLDMCDSLRRRHVALSHAILPQVLEELHHKAGRAVVVKNLGSGVGVNGFKPQIIEMAGFLDYRPDEKAVALMSRIYSLLPMEGHFVTCHIHPNFEWSFLRWALCWPMLYRKKENFLRLIEASGRWRVQTTTEPHGIHTVAVCRKI